MAKRSTRDMIVGVAAGLFATAGLRRTTMETIAAAAGRGRRTVYMYFSNKAEIYDAVVEMEIRNLAGPLSNIVQTEGPFDLILMRYSEERVRGIGRLLERNPLLMKDFAMGHSRIERLRDKLQKAEMKMLVPLFRQYAAGSSAPGNHSPEDFASMLLNLLRGTDRLITKTDGLYEAIRLSSLSTWVLLRAIECEKPPPV